MPSEEIFPLFRAGKLHSGRGKRGKNGKRKKGKIVHNKKQAKAILLSTLRKEGRIGPQKKKGKKKLQRKRVSAKR
jgi:hypothetical protein